MKLTIELVPATSWYNNLRSAIPKSVWDKLRKRTYAEHNHKCAICGVERRLHCHELWKYDDQSYIQSLGGFTALCSLCHHVKHIGLADILANQGKLDYERVIQHFIEVNSCNIETFNRHKRAAFKQWRERSKHKWYVDLGEYSNLVEGGQRHHSRT